MCASILVYVVQEFSEHYKVPWRREGLSWPHRRLSGSPLRLLQSFHLQVHICQGCKLDQLTEVLGCVLADNRGFIQLRTDIQLCGCCLQLNVPPRKGSSTCWDVKLQQHTDTTPSIHPCGCSVVLSRCLVILVRLKLFFIGK